ncbi:MAG: HAMP domain-containing protein [Elusimicrobia bacterium]|nr:HAMP domain-containing protein [Elusimicrobiota bacterium]
MKLRWKILLFFLTVGVIPAVLSVFFIRSQKSVSKDIEKSLFAVTSGAAKISEHFILNAQKSVSAAAFLPASLLPPSGTASHRRYLKRLYRKFKYFYSIAIVRQNGNILVFYGKRPRSAGKIMARRRGVSFVSDIVGIDGVDSVAVVSRIRNSDCFLAAFINMETLKKILDKVSPFGDSVFYLIDPAGKKLFLKEKGKTSGRFRKASFRGVDYDYRIIALGGEKYFEVFAPLSNFPGWRVCLAVRYKSAFRNLIVARRLGLFFSVFSLLLAGVLAFYFSKKISQPVEEIASAAEEFASGNLGFRIKISTGDEFENLAARFNEMAEKLDNARKGVDEKMRKATRELSNAYREIAVKNEELAKADRYKSQFLANMSHELRTPMNAIIGFTDLLKDGIYGKLTNKQKEILSKVQRNSNHLLNLINDILDLSRIEAGRIEILPEKFELKNLVDTLSEEISRPAQGVKFEIICPPGIFVFQDMMRLKQVLFNLLSNAFKFTKEGFVKLEVFPREKIVSIKVEDSGIGIKKEDITKIFETFQQADASITRKFQGTGLGLSISKKLVELMGGWIEVDSVYGKGSVFTVNIPYEMTNKGKLKIKNDK